MSAAKLIESFVEGRGPGLPAYLDLAGLTALVKRNKGRWVGASNQPASDSYRFPTRSAGKSFLRGLGRIGFKGLVVADEFDPDDDMDWGLLYQISVTRKVPGH